MKMKKLLVKPKTEPTLMVSFILRVFLIYTLGKLSNVDWFISKFVPGALNYEEQEKRTRAIVSSETASILGALGLKGQPLDVRIRKLADERDDLGDTVRRLKVITELKYSYLKLLC